MTGSTFPGLLAGRLRADPARPLVTFYDDATGERVELSVLTYANWVAKTAALVQDELDLARGDLVLLDLPTHWLGPVWLGAAWTVGAVVTADRGLAAEARLVACGPAGVDRYAPLAEHQAVVALSLRPLGGRFLETLPPGVVDYGAVVLAQPDTFVPADPPTPQDPAWRGATRTVAQAELTGLDARPGTVAAGGRLLTDVNPCSEPGLPLLVAAVRDGAGVVWVANPDPRLWERRYAEERATAQVRSGRS